MTEPFVLVQNCQLFRANFDDRQLFVKHMQKHIRVTICRTCMERHRRIFLAHAVLWTHAPAVPIDAIVGTCLHCQIRGSQMTVGPKFENSFLVAKRRNI
jgi:hypothetical protein